MSDFELKSPAQVKKMKKAEMFEHMEGLYELLEYCFLKGAKLKVENEKLKAYIDELKNDSEEDSEEDNEEEDITYAKTDKNGNILFSKVPF